MSVIIRKEIENKQKTIIITLHKCPTSLLLRLCFLEKKICRNTRGTERAGEHKQTGSVHRAIKSHGLINLENK